MLFVKYKSNSFQLLSIVSKVPGSISAVINNASNSSKLITISNPFTLNASDFLFDKSTVAIHAATKTFAAPGAHAQRDFINLIE